MSDLLGSLKSDLLDRRMLPILVLVGAALIGALAYAASGGSGPGSTQARSVSPTLPPGTSGSASSIAVSPASTVVERPVAETTSGSAHRSSGATRNPFAPLAAAKTASASAITSHAATAPGSGSSGSATPGSSSAGSPASKESSPPTTGAGATPTPKSKPTPTESKPAPSKGNGNTQTVYRVAVLFGAVPAGTAAPAPNLTQYDNLKRQQPLPSVTQPLVVFRGVIAGAKSATFTLVGEAILRGNAACRPSASQCQAIDLKLGEVEELEYVPPQGAPIVYQLQLSSITASKASAAAARLKLGDQSKTGLQLLRTVGLFALPGMRYSSAKGVLVFAGRPAFASRSSIGRAHAAAWGATFRR